MKSKENVSFSNTDTKKGSAGKYFPNFSRRGFLKVALGTTALTSPPSPAEEFSLNKSKDNIKHQQFIIDQIDKINEIIAGQKYDKILSSPYLIHCLYYSQAFLDKISNPRNQSYVSEKIIGSVRSLITPEFKEQAIKALEKQTQDKEILENKKISTRETAPLKNFNFGTGANHEGAVDLFTDELSPVYSMGSGLIVVAENGWDPKNELSTSSTKGGNSVIVFNYLTKEFYRYIHLNKIVVIPGELVMEGENIGTVGHTGKDASLMGHGKHLHLEIRKYISPEFNNQLLSVKDLKKRLKNLKSTI